MTSQRRSRMLNWTHGDETLIMGIINVTPDSFSDGGEFAEPNAAIRHAYQLIEEGADVIDVGAESTRPTASPVSEDEEWLRLKPVLEELAIHSPVPVSVDTFKAKTAARALELGVDIINDVWGGLADEAMLSVVSEANCPYIWMHNRPRPATGNGFDTLIQETETGIATCIEAGIKQANLWIDPGIGFGKTYEQNLYVLKRLDEFCRLGYPVLLGTSRKSVIGHTLQVPAAERLEGSLATVSLGVHAGVGCVRVHDVSSTVKACRMAEAIVHAGG